MIDSKDQFKLGYTQGYPLYNYGLALGFTFKRISIDALFQGVSDITRFACDNFAWPLHRLSKQVFEYELDAWSPNNRDSRYPAIHNEAYRQHNNIKDGAINEVSVYNVSYVRLKNVNISYSLPEKILKKAKISSVNIFLRANNLFTWCPNYPIGDPEASDGGNEIANGFYPMTRTITAGLQLGF